jgi:signal transduction histidine kinase
MVYTLAVMKHHFPKSWIIVAITVPLLGMLAWNQFNWLQELQNRERERIQYSMLNSAEALSKRLREEILFLPSLLRVREGRREQLDKLFGERYRFWQYYAISPGMIKDIKLLDEQNDEVLDWNMDHFEKTGGKIYRKTAKNPDEMLITMPIFLGRDFRGSIVCVFDRNKMITEVIPYLAKNSLNSTDLYAYRIVDSRDGSVVYTSQKKYSEKTFAHPDIELPLLEDVKVPAFQNAPELPARSMQDENAETFTFIKERAKIDPSDPQANATPQAFGNYFLQIVNIDGSLETLSRNATIQNALLSFGIVVLLAFLIAALAETTRKSDSLALSQQEFIATITHELKTPLAVISSAAQNLTDGLIRDQKKAEQYGQMIRKEALRLGASIEHFLLYSNTASIARMKPEGCDVSELVQTALKFTEEERAAAEFRTDVIMPEGPLFVRGDRIALESVFQNLAQNVLRHARSGRYLGIVVSVEKARKKDNTRNIVIKFRDKGPGIPAKEQKLIFEPFARGRRAVEGQIPGNGIGLNLVKRIIIMHGGSVSVESKIDTGSTFIIMLPEEKGAIDGE